VRYKVGRDDLALVVFTGTSLLAYLLACFLYIELSLNSDEVQPPQNSSLIFDLC